MHKWVGRAGVRMVGMVSGYRALPAWLASPKYWHFTHYTFHALHIALVVGGVNHTRDGVAFSLLRPQLLEPEALTLATSSY